MDKHIRYRLDVAYDGTNFSGWAKQPGLRTVQGILEEALMLILPRVPGTDFHPQLVVAGRTDAGVHALGQVAHLDIPVALVEKGFDRRQGEFEEMLLKKISRAIARDSDVVVRNISVAPDGFDARFSAVARTYEYKIADAQSAKNPLSRFDRWQQDAELSETLLNEVSSLLLGLRDFGAFCNPREGATTIRDLQEFSWMRASDGTLIGRLTADAFCHSMVRNLVGGVVEVAKGRLNLARLNELLDTKERSPEIKVAPAHGLTLISVQYPADSELRRRAEQTKGMREL